MMEHKTLKVGAYLRDCHERFDFEINSMVSDGWTVDCKSAGGPPEDFVFVAFLSREVPSSPPLGGNTRLPTCGYTRGQAMDIFQFGRGIHANTPRAKADTLFNEFVDGLKPIEIGERTPTERPSNDLLKQWFKSAYSIFASQVGPWDEAELFQEWVASLPADPLEADRELVYREFFVCKHGGKDEPKWVGWGDDYREALRRLCGKGGESNG